jgi:hypothetical protein
MRTAIGLLSFVCLSLGAAPVGAADRVGPTGKVRSLEINMRGSDNFTAYRGAIEVAPTGATNSVGKGKPKGKPGKPKGKPGGGGGGGGGGSSSSEVVQYQWGGTNCPNRDLDGDQVQLLRSAMSGSAKIEPRWLPGQMPDSRCLVSFKILRS